MLTRILIIIMMMTPARCRQQLASFLPRRGNMKRREH